jgi:hypothetical protein
VQTKGEIRVGLVSYLGDATTINGPISCASKMINCVLASVAEAEIAGGFQVAQAAVHLRNILNELGYPQPPTLIRMDNTVAIGIAMDTINTKRSKSIDMRFYWLRDCIRQGQFKAAHIAGILQITSPNHSLKRNWNNF